METESVDNEEGPWNEKVESVTNPEKKANETEIDTFVLSESLSLTMKFPRLPIRNQGSQFDDSPIILPPSIDCDRLNVSKNRNRAIGEESDRFTIDRTISRR